MQVFLKLGAEFRPLISHSQIRSLSPKELARLILKALGKKRFIEIVLMQTEVGGSLSFAIHHSDAHHRRILRQM